MKTLTIEVAMVIKNAFEMPEFWKKVVPSERGKRVDQFPRSEERNETRVAHTVEDEVDAGKLLPSLDKDAGEGAEADLVVRRLEAIEIRALAHLFFFLESRTNVLELDKHLLVVDGKRSEARKGLGGFIHTALLDEVARRLQGDWGYSATRKGG